MFSALLMGLAGSVHCVAMCGAASAAVVSSCSPGQPRAGWGGFHLGRLLGYAAAGAVAAASVGLLARIGQWSPALRPLWTLAHMAGLALGLYLLWQGRQPAWLERMGRGGDRQGQVVRVVRTPSGGAWRAGSLGALWWAWPCGLLQSALLVAALANGPVGGALVMAVFALGSSVGLGLLPWLWARWNAGCDDRARRWTVWVIRLSGLALAAASAWALGHDLFMRVVAWCLS